MKYLQRRILILALSACISGSLLAINASAENLSGREEVEFTQAVAEWLNDNDRDSLLTLSELAARGNVAARILLSRIERTERYQSEYISGLSNEERLNLFRSPQRKGVFQQTWIQVEEEKGNRLAAALRKTGLSYIDLSTIEELRAMGEIMVTDQLIKSAAFHGNNQIRKTILDSLDYPELVPFIQSQMRPAVEKVGGMEVLKHVTKIVEHSAETDFTPTPDTVSVAKFLSLGTPFGIVRKDSKWRKTIEDWLMKDNSMQPIRNTCSRSCPSEVETCALGVLGLTGGYYEAIRLYSPLESIIPQSDFLSSKRAENRALRRAALRRAEHDGEIVDASEINQFGQCLAKQVSRIRNEG